MFDIVQSPACRLVLWLNDLGVITSRLSARKAAIPAIKQLALATIIVNGTGRTNSKIQAVRVHVMNAIVMCLAVRVALRKDARRRKHIKKNRPGALLILVTRVAKWRLCFGHERVYSGGIQG